MQRTNSSGKVATLLQGSAQTDCYPNQDLMRVSALEDEVKNVRALIVDDNPQARRLIRLMATEPDDIIYECSNGREAIDAFQKHRPDWVFMDIEMPVMDGLTATRQLLAQHPAAKIVAVTQYCDKLLEEAAQEAGASAFVVKDNLLVLRKVVQEYNSASNQESL